MTLHDDDQHTLMHSPAISVYCKYYTEIALFSYYLSARYATPARGPSCRAYLEMSTVLNPDASFELLGRNRSIDGSEDYSAAIQTITCDNLQPGNDVQSLAHEKERKGLGSNVNHVNSSRSCLAVW